MWNQDEFDKSFKRTGMMVNAVFIIVIMVFLSALFGIGYIVVKIATADNIAQSAGEFAGEAVKSFNEAADSNKK